MSGHHGLGSSSMSGSLRGREVMTEGEKKPLLIRRKEEVQRRRVRQETGKYAVSENHLSGDVSHSECCIMNYLFIHPFHSVGINFMTAELQKVSGSRCLLALRICSNHCVITAQVVLF